MKIFKYILFASIFMSCEDYLTKIDDDSGFISEEDVWGGAGKIRQTTNRLYDCTSSFFEISYTKQLRHAGGPGKNYGHVMQLSGELVSTRPIETNTSMIPGDWFRAVNINSFGNPDFWNIWSDMWEAVFVSNLILDKIDGVQENIMPRSEIDQIKGEAYAFRALAYHEISKRWGPMPYIKVPLAPDIILDQVRPSFGELINDIVEDCDAAIALLPEVSYLNDPVLMGRIGKAAVMGLKSRALTVAASPNNNPDGDVDLWRRAAIAAWEVIELSRTPDSKIGLYQGPYNDIFYGQPGTIEGLWPRFFNQRTFHDVYHIQYLWVKAGSSRSSLGNSPTQELVDKFETADGWPIENASSGYTDDNPYTNRDPRFYTNILKHGDTRAKFSENEVLDMMTHDINGNVLSDGDLGDRDAPFGSQFGNSKTGYLVKKIVPDRYNQAFVNNAVYTNMPYIRMAEMYLNYAEAMNEFTKDPNAILDTLLADLSAVDALNVIRNRVGHVNVRTDFTNDYKLFQQRVRNEFWIELCFEYHLWFDLLRWREAKDFLHNHNFHGMLLFPDPSKPTGIRFERFEIPLKRVFEDKHYRYPLKESDMQTLTLVEQNPGW